MNDKYAKEIAKELHSIRKELQKMNKQQGINIDGIDSSVINKAIDEEMERQERAGDRVTIK